MILRRVVPTLALGLLTALLIGGGCPVVTVSISPSSPTMLPGSSRQFTATVAGMALPKLQWTLIGPRLPGADWGNLTDTGLYTAPLTAPPGQIVVVVRVLGNYNEALAIAQAPINLLAPGLFACSEFLSTQHTFPDDLAWDGSSLWGVNLQAADSLSRVHPASAQYLDSAGNPAAAGSPAYTTIQRQNGSTIVINAPTGLTWDGTYLWLATDYFTGGVLRQVTPDPNSSALLEVASFAYQVPQGQGGPRGLAWDGQSLWVADDVFGRVYEIDPTTGVALSSFATAGFSSGQPTGLTWDGGFLWLATYQDATYWRLSRSGVVERSQPACCLGPTGLAWDGALWADDDLQDVIHRLSLTSSFSSNCPQRP